MVVWLCISLVGEAGQFVGLKQVTILSLLHAILCALFFVRFPSRALVSN